MDTPIRKTRKSWDEAGHAHFLTYSCHQRLPLLCKDRSRQWVVDALRDVRIRFDVAIWAYVIMPEHVHALVLPRRANYEMRVLHAAIKRPVSKEAKSFLVEANQLDWIERLTVRMPSRSVFRFWEPGGGYDHNVFRERTVPDVIDYIHANPVRRGLVERPRDWKWSSARFWEGDREVPLMMDEPYV